MDRTHTVNAGVSAPKRRESSAVREPGVRLGSWWDQLIIRIVFSAACVAAGFHFHPFGLTPTVAASSGLLFSLAIFVVETRLQRASLRRLIGGSVGTILGILASY